MMSLIYRKRLRRNKILWKDIFYKLFKLDSRWQIKVKKKNKNTYNIFWYIIYYPDVDCIIIIKRPLLTTKFYLFKIFLYHGKYIPRNLKIRLTIMLYFYYRFIYYMSSRIKFHIIKE